MWFTEDLEGLGVRIRVKKKIVERETDYQKIEVYESDLGKLLVIDGKIQLTERDEFHYHEMLVHVPLLSIENPEDVLIIGGGDGGALREVLKHDPDRVILVEIDPGVVEISREYIGVDRGAFDDPRVELIYMDGYRFVKETDNTFDVILIDSYDPSEVSSPLFSESFYGRCAEILKGCISMQSQSPFLQFDEFKRIVSSLKRVYKHVHPYLAFTPSYPSGMWSFVYSSKISSTPDINVLKERIVDRKIETRYYTPEIHFASFSLPKWIEEGLE